MRMRFMALTILAIGLLAACAKPLPEPTPVPTDVPTPTPVPLTELDLEPLLVQPHDLPPQLNASQVRDQAPDIVPGLLEPVAEIYQAFGRTDGGTVFELSGVYVFLYDDPEEAEAAYLFVLEAMREGRTQGASPTFADQDDVHVEDSVGERSAWMRAPFFDFEPITDLTWLKCNALLYVRMRGDSDAAVAYARRLTERLEPMVCRAEAE